MAGSARAWVAGSGLGHDRRSLLALTAIMALGFLVRLVPVLRGGGLAGLGGYDDGVYFGSAIALVHGVLPYRDFLLLHPPGEPVALVPFALLGSVAGDDVAFAIARLATMALGAFAAVLATIVAGRHLRLAGIAAGLLYATWDTAASADRSTDLHTLQGALLLVSLLILVRPGRISARRAALAGIPIGLATSVQLWQGLSAVILLLWITTRAPGAVRDVRARLRPPVAFGLTTGVAFLAVCLPFFVAAPGQMLRYTLFDQVGRASGGVRLVERLLAIEGLPRLLRYPGALRPVIPEVAVVIALVAFGIMAVAAVRLPWTRPWAALVAAGTAVVLVTPSFYSDYAAFAAPPASLALGTGIAWLCLRSVRTGTRIRITATTGVALLIVLLGLSAAMPQWSAIKLAALTGEVRDATCVASDQPTLLVVTGALRRNVQHRCRMVLDPTGIRHDADRDSLPGGLPARSLTRAAGYQAAMVAWYGSSDAAMLTTSGGFTEATERTIGGRLPEVHRLGIVVVRRAAP